MRAGSNIEEGDIITIGDDPIGVAVSSSDLDGTTRVLINGSTFADGVHLGAGSQLHNCHIDGGVEMSGNNCVISGCVVHAASGYGISFTPQPQNGVQLVGDNWPQEAVTEINEGRCELQARGFIGTEPVLSGHPSIIRCLDEQIPNTDTTYRLFLLRNNLVSSIYESLEIDGVTLAVPGEGYEIMGNFGTLSKRKPKFSNEVIEKAWKLLEEYVSPSQYFAFMEGSNVEIENNDRTFRLLIDKKGVFTVLEGKRGEGIVATSGRIKSYDYPLGDEIATFLDWFKFKTKELISQWNCGTYGIVKEGERR